MSHLPEVPSGPSNPSHGNDRQNQITGQKSSSEEQESRCPVSSLLGNFFYTSTSTLSHLPTSNPVGTLSSFLGIDCPLRFGRHASAEQAARKMAGGGVCPLGFGKRQTIADSQSSNGTEESANSPSIPLPEMTLARLRDHAHLHLLSVKGTIYDVSPQAEVRTLPTMAWKCFEMVLAYFCMFIS